MRIFLTGATGLVGRRLTADRRARGDAIVALSRDASRAARTLGAGVEVVAGDAAVPGPWQAAVDGCDAVVHLAGEGILDRRWNDAVKRRLRDSRIDGTHQVVEAIRAARRRPGVLVSASAIGWYGPTTGPVDETAPAAEGFFADLCRDWEAQAAEAAGFGVRVVSLRIGMVLDPRGGALPQMLQPLRLFVGGPIGLGRAVMSWIHWADLVGLVDLALRDPRAQGPMNATAPEPATNRAVMAALARAIGRPSWLPVPPFALRLALGEVASFIFASQDVRPAKALALGYRFAHPTVHDAVSACLEEEPSAPAVVAPAGPVAPAPRAAAPASVTAVGTVARGAGTASATAAAVDLGTRPERAPRLCAIGVDGTLLRRDGRLPEGVAIACRAAQDAGATIVLAGTRPPRVVAPLARTIGLRAPVIAYCGAVIWHPERGEALFHDALDPDDARAVVRLARETAPEVHVAIERLDRWFTDRAPDEGEADNRPDAVGPLDEHLGEPVTMVCLRGEPAAIARVRAGVERGPWREGRVSRFAPAANVLLVAAPRVDKAIALQRIAQRAGIARDEVLAIGDGASDLGMLEWSGFPVAVANATEPARRLARAVVPSCDDNGVARALHRFVLRTAEAPRAVGSDG